MNFKFYTEKLKYSDEYKRFIKENEEAFMCSAFFSIDKIGNDNQKHIDFFIPNSKKIVSFDLNSEIIMREIESTNNYSPNKINGDLDFDFKVIEKMIEKKMKKENLKNSIQKILISIQNLKNNNFAIITIFISKMGLIKATINLDKKEFLDFEKKSFFDIIKIIKKND